MALFERLSHKNATKTDFLKGKYRNGDSDHTLLPPRNDVGLDATSLGGMSVSNDTKLDATSLGGVPVSNDPGHDATSLGGMSVNDDTTKLVTSSLGGIPLSNNTRFDATTLGGGPVNNDLEPDETRSQEAQDGKAYSLYKYRNTNGK